ncbi:hypothetical protein AFLA_003034 [Aspergillus flavus NRRL3357]|nr:hypothetical protein AFLA_003034 [Aspergillus flavus NRRL3357]KOC16050.1 hypothetical protein AFLA70_18g005471 [Aspergillus flavus AF70]
MLKRLSWTPTFPQTSTSNSSPPPRTRRQDAAGNYLRREKLQALLERLFPDHPGLNFHIRLDDEIWSFDAPREVTRQELREASD